ncbi:MAG: hypothetical protein ABI051_15735 [Vicinamibacterales bacterium]
MASCCWRARAAARALASVAARAIRARDAAVALAEEVLRGVEAAELLDADVALAVRLGAFRTVLRVWAEVATGTAAMTTRATARTSHA